MAKKDQKTETKKEVTPDIVDTNKAGKPKKTKKEKVAKSKTPSVKKEKVKQEKKAVPAKKTVETQSPKKNPLASIVKFLWSVREKHLSDVLEDLMTEKEIQEFAERIEILRQLQKWVTQRVIAKNLGISVTTVSRWSKVLQTGKEKIKKYL